MGEPEPRLRRLKRLSAKSSETETVVKYKEEEEEESGAHKEEEDDQEDEELRKFRVEISIKNGKRSRKDLGAERSAKLGNQWRTPRSLIDYLQQWSFARNATFIGDACAAEENNIFPFYYTEQINAMNQSWFRLENVLHDKRFTAPRLVLCCDNSVERPVSYWYINCPYGKDAYKHDITDWLRKCALEAQKGVGVVALVPCPNGEVNRWHHVFGKASEVLYIQGRLKFGDPVTGEEKMPAKFGCVLIHWDPRKLCPSCGKGQPIETKSLIV